MTSRSLCVLRFPRHYDQHFSQHSNWKRRDSKLHQQQIVRNKVYVNFTTYCAFSLCFGLSRILVSFFFFFLIFYICFLFYSHPSICFFANLFISSFVLSLTLFFSLQIPSSLFSLGGITHLSTFSLISVCSFLLFYSIAIWLFSIMSCDLIFICFDLTILLVSNSLGFVFPLFFFFSCWLSSTYDLIWIFVAFLTATGVVSLKSDFAIQYQNCNFSRRYLNYSTCTLLCCIFFPLFYLYLFIHIFIFCFALIFLAWQFYTRACHKRVDHLAANRSQQDSASPVRWSIISFPFFFSFFFFISKGF